MYCYETAPAPVECPEGCACLTLDEAKNQGYSLYCEGKQTICGYDNNNVPMYCWTKAVPPPDLLVRGVRLNILGGGEFEIEYTIANWGRGDSPPSVTGLYVDGILVAEDAITGLLSAEERDEVFRWHYDSASCTPPEDIIRITVDYRDEIDESYEDNNDDSLTWECPEAEEPDLHIRQLWTEPLGGGEHRIGYEIENLGLGPSPSSRTGLYVDDVCVAYDDVGPLSPLERSEEEFSLAYDLTTCTGDSDILRIVVDYEDDIDETNEYNNDDSLTWECPERAKPDLVILNVWYEHEPSSLQNMSLHYSIENRSVTAAGPSLVRLSINDERIATSHVPELDGGEVLAMVTFPERWTPMRNDNHVQVFADAGCVINESVAGERNNCLETDWVFELSCFDGFQNRDEEEIDCGGRYCPPCNRCDLAMLPSQFDWRDYYTFPPVRDQCYSAVLGIWRKCGSCWAHAALGTIEGTYVVQTGIITNLSEQYVICEVRGDCGGGCPHDVLKYTRDHGIVDENCCPYLAANSPCDKCADWEERLWWLHEYHRVSSNVEEIKRALICYGPISVGSENWRHAIVIVGYDDDVVLPGYSPGCWIIRNSWGEGYGIDLDNDGANDDPGYGLIPYSGHSHSDIKNYAHYVIGVVPPQ